MNRFRISSLACALTAALALSACSKTGDGTAGTTGSTGTAGSTTGGGMAASPSASAASR